MTWMRQPSWQGIALFLVRMEFWRSTGQAPDNSHLFTRDMSTQEIYALDVDFP
jgi:hypothetical protein